MKQIEENVMTAREAGDRIARRPRKPPQAEGDCEGSPYLCENCGSTEFDVVQLTQFSLERTETLDCTCEKGEVYAARRTLLETWATRSRSFLDEEHRPQDWSTEEEDRETEQRENEIECNSCLEDSDEEDWDTEDGEEEETDPEFEVRCHSCGHEVEFGWSHPNRGGRIWPVESVDFNPWKTWPEARFIEDWKRRGWLRPADRL